MNQTIADAVGKRGVLRFTYRGHERTVEPHAYGRSTAGHDVLRCWQTGGTSESGQTTGWKLMLVAEMRGVTDTGTCFSGERPDYRRCDKAMSAIYAEL